MFLNLGIIFSAKYLAANFFDAYLSGADSAAFQLFEIIVELCIFDIGYKHMPG